MKVSLDYIRKQIRKADSQLLFSKHFVLALLDEQEAEFREMLKIEDERSIDGFGYTKTSYDVIKEVLGE